MTTIEANREVARTALEQVCSRGAWRSRPSATPRTSPTTAGSLEYHGLDGVERSTALYRALFDDLAFDVVDQVAEGDRVASRFVLPGPNCGRRVRPWRITISRLRDGRIVEDHSAFDSLELLKQLRAWRTVLAACGHRSRGWLGSSSSGRGGRCSPRRGCCARYATGVAAEPIAISVVIAISRARASRTGERDSAR